MDDNIINFSDYKKKAEAGNGGGFPIILPFPPEILRILFQASMEMHMQGEEEEEEDLSEDFMKQVLSDLKKIKKEIQKINKVLKKKT